MASANSDLVAANCSEKAFYGRVPRGYIRLYHYTNRRGAVGIMEKKKILKSTKTIRNAPYANTDAIFGEGTYLTDKDPARHNKLEIAKDLWVDGDKFHDRMVEEGRTDFVFAIIMEKDAVEEMESQYHIWLYPNKDLDLTKVYMWCLEETDKVERKTFEQYLVKLGVTITKYYESCNRVVCCSYC